MKTKYISLFSILITSLSLIVGCRKYVEIETYGSRTLVTTSDYQYLINNKGNFETSTILPMVSSDDVSPNTSAAVINQWGQQLYNAFLWRENFFTDEQQDAGWNNLYKQIYVANEVLLGVMESKDGTSSQKQRIAAEAKVHRAFAYLVLVNQYAPIYNPSQAANQQGLPLLLTPNLFQNLGRASLQEVYDQILVDLLTSVEALPVKPLYNYHPSKLAVYALLSRVYLYMRNFEESGRYADLALSLNPDLLNIETYITGIYPPPLNDEELILSKLSAGSVTGPINPELITLYNPKDLRLTYLMEINASLGGYKFMKPSKSGSYFTQVGLSTPEIYLNRAEVYARSNDLEHVVEMLNIVRKKRFKAVDYVALTGVDVQEDLLKAVLDERRREFVGTDLRWYDMRRLTLDGSYYKPVVRQYEGQMFTLDASSPRFVFPINQEVLKLNPEIGQNPR